MVLLGTLLVGLIGPLYLGCYLKIDWLRCPSTVPSSPKTPNNLFNNLASDGAAIVDAWTTASHTPLLNSVMSQHPSTLLEGTVGGGLPWCFLGSQGRVGILLRSPGVLRDIGIQVRRETSMFQPPWISSSTAPREVVIWGLIDGNKSRRQIQQIMGLPPPTKLFPDTPHLFILIAHLEYNGRITAPVVQRAATDSLISGSLVRFGLVVVEVRSNWGGASTCLHGIDVSSEENM